MIFTHFSLFLFVTAFSGVAQANDPPVNCPVDPTGKYSAALDPTNNQNCICNGSVKNAIYNSTLNSCACPAKYDEVATKAGLACLPTLPKTAVTSSLSEYFRNEGSAFYPVCGINRVPMNWKTMSTSTIASSGVPLTNKETTYHSSATSSIVFPYSTPSSVSATPTPIYFYDSAQLSQCACTINLKGPSASTSVATPLPPTLSTEKARFLPDTFDAISAQSSNSTDEHAPVAMAKDPSNNGRLGDVFSAGNAGCFCPNLNEVMTNIDSSKTNEPVGAVCRPIMGVGKGLLVAYNPAAHADLVKTTEQLGTNGKPVTSVILPTSIAGGISPYQRRIWVCPPLMTMTPSGACSDSALSNACDGGGVDEQPSSVSSLVTGKTTKEQFDNAINKKLACCLNDSALSVAGAPTKFDCIETPSAQKKDFNTLWSTGDSSQDGGQMNAVVLTNAQGKIVSGFYSSEGHHCDQFSEFAGTVTPSRVTQAQGGSSKNQGVNNEALTPILNATTLSTPPQTPYTVLNRVVTSDTWAKRVPTTAVEARACPILVRAAIVVTCPVPTGDPTTTRTVITNGENRCKVADKIMIHVRIEQIFEIGGQATMSPVDSILDPTKAGNINVSDILMRKYGKP